MLSVEHTQIAVYITHRYIDSILLQSEILIGRRKKKKFNWRPLLLS